MHDDPRLRLAEYKAERWLLAFSRRYHALESGGIIGATLAQQRVKLLSWRGWIEPIAYCNGVPFTYRLTADGEIAALEAALEFCCE